MDEPTPAELREDGGENQPETSRTSPEPSASPSAEEPAHRVGVFCCRDCGEAFRDEAAHSEHRSQHSQDNLCLDDQLDGVRGADKDCETPYFCTLCSLSFVELGEFHLHMKNHDEISPKESRLQMNSGTTKQQIFECSDCGKSYGVLGHLLNHQRSHKPPSKSVFHDLEHLKKKSFQCEFCGRSYSRASALDAHRRCHEEKLVKSKNKSVGDVTETREPVAENKPSEIRAEDGSSLFKCACGKAFSALLRLRTHQRFSRNSQCSPEEIKQKSKKSCSDFYCHECKKAFNSHIALFNHQRWHTKQSDDSAKKFSCEECGKVFMTLTFYYRHQRTAHSEETPAKSFLHQVCQLQKKAFECSDCGLKFSRASALHSHQIHHTDAFKETEKGGPMRSPVAPQEKIESAINEVEHSQAWKEAKVELRSFFPASTMEESHVNETEEDMESYEPGDFNVQVISASESEDELVPDPNPDLELLCESDQEMRDDVFSPESLISKQGMDLKIVQIDLEQADEPGVLTARDSEKKDRFDCPECYRWFSSPSSLRVHRMWHSVRRRKQQIEGQSAEFFTCGTCGFETNSYAAHCSHMQIHSDQSVNSDVSPPAEGWQKKNLTCDKCGKIFSRLSAFVAHQSHHPRRKRFQCPDCMMSYLHSSSLHNHMKTCSMQKKENISGSKKEYNPKKTLLGPKIYHCEQCGKGFWSLGAYSHHKQSQTQCTDLRLRKGSAGSVHSVGHARSRNKVACPVCGRKFRHKGIMASHMRKHENGNHKCDLCNRSFTLFSSLLRHQVVHSEQLLPPPVKSFQHQVEQLQKNTYSCPDCGKLFSRAKALQFHLKSHGYETGHAPASPGSAVTLEGLQCPTCFAHFNNKGSLKAHRKLCNKRGGQDIQKTESSNHFDASEVQRVKMDIGTQESSDQFNVHAQARNNVDPRGLKPESDADGENLEHPSTSKLKYKCGKCDKRFSGVDALNSHYKIHDEDDKSVIEMNLEDSVTSQSSKEGESNKGPFHCSECGRRFMSNSALGSHKRWHGEKKCSLLSLKDKNLKSVHHAADDKSFQCNKCSKQFFSHHILQRHYMFNPHCRNGAQAESDCSQSEQISCSDSGFPQLEGLEAQLSETYEAAKQQADGPRNRIPEPADKNCSENEDVSVNLKGHKCPSCSLVFANTRGLRCHQWQVHSEGTKGKKRAPFTVNMEDSDAHGKVPKTEDSLAVEMATVETENSPIGRKIKKAQSPGKSVACLDCGKQCSCVGELLNHKKVCLVIRQESKLEVQAAEAPAEVSPPLSVVDHAVKCFFKCKKCGKAFQTEEQLESHKIKAKSRPYCCALCCHGFWTENQLQQHLAWHDQVRCRLPNEVRYRLSAALSSRPGKAALPAAHAGGKPLPSSPSKLPFSQPSSHKCQHCGKTFLSPTALQKHKAQPCDANSSYHCSICPRMFSDIQELINHHQECISKYKRESEGPAAVSPGDPNNLTCIVCGTTFCDATDFLQHCIEHAQVEQCSIKCEDCGLKFDHQDDYKTHLHQHALEEEDGTTEDGKHPAAGSVPERGNEEEDGGENETSLALLGAQDAYSASHYDGIRKVYTCPECGKIYTYLVSFQKHQALHRSPPEPKGQAGNNVLPNYECPDCGMSFIRRTRLLSHLRVHRKQKKERPSHLRCDQCNRSFISTQSWLTHLELHKQKPFWCLSCALGFRSEETLDRHLLNHGLRQKQADQKKPLLPTKRVPGEKLYRCPVCGKSFCHPKRLFSHRKKHLGGGTRAKPLPESFTETEGDDEKDGGITKIKEEPEWNTDMDELLKSEEPEQMEEGGKPQPDDQGENHESSDDSDCGEPLHCLRISKEAGSAGSDNSDPNSEMDESSSQQTKLHRDHKYWDWECYECDMGFDDMADLHLHYIKHATGEVPMPQYDNIEG